MSFRKTKILKFISVFLIGIFLGGEIPGYGQKSAWISSEAATLATRTQPDEIKRFFPSFDQPTKMASLSTTDVASQRMQKRKLVVTKQLKRKVYGVMPWAWITSLIIAHAILPSFGKASLHFLQPLEAVWFFSLFGTGIYAFYMLGSDGFSKLKSADYSFSRKSEILLYVLMSFVMEFIKMYLVGKSTVGQMVLLFAFQSILIYFASTWRGDGQRSWRGLSANVLVMAIMIIAGYFKGNLFSVWGGFWPLVALLVFLIADAMYRTWSRSVVVEYGVYEILFLSSVTIFTVSSVLLFFSPSGFLHVLSPELLTGAVIIFSIVKNMSNFLYGQNLQYFSTNQISVIAKISTPLAIAIVPLVYAFLAIPFTASPTWQWEILIGSFYVAAAFIAIFDRKNEIGLGKGWSKSDLHVTSSYSVNAWHKNMYSPERIVEEVIDRRVGVFSIADHHTIRGVLAAHAALERRDKTEKFKSQLIPAVEMHTKEGLHLLVYFPDMTTFLATAEKIEMDLAPLRKNDSAEKIRWDVDQTIAWANNLGIGAVIILAHPGAIKRLGITKTLSEEELYDLFDRGLDGVEADSLFFRSRDVVRYLAIVGNYNSYHPDRPRIVTVGSDFHSPDKVFLTRQSEDGKEERMVVAAEIGRGASLRNHVPHAYSWDERIGENLIRLSRLKRESRKYPWKKIIRHSKNRMPGIFAMNPKGETFSQVDFRVVSANTKRGFPDAEKIIREAAERGVQVIAISDLYLKKGQEPFKSVLHAMKYSEQINGPVVIPSVTLISKEGFKAAIYFPDREDFSRKVKELAAALPEKGKWRLREITDWVHKNQGISILIYSRNNKALHNPNRVRELLDQDWVDGLEIDKGALRSYHRLHLLAALTLHNIGQLLNPQGPKLQKVFLVGSGPNGEAGIGWPGRVRFHHKMVSWGISPAEMLMRKAAELRPGRSGSFLQEIKFFQAA